jgi:hypothetical protein
VNLRKILFSMIVRLPKCSYNKLYIYLLSLYFGDYYYIVTFNYFLENQSVLLIFNYINIVIKQCAKYSSIRNVESTKGDLKHYEF